MRLFFASLALAGSFESGAVHVADEGFEALSVVDPYLVDLAFVVGKLSGDGLAVDLGRPLPVRAVELEAASSWHAQRACSSAGVARRHAALEDRADLLDLVEEGAVLTVEAWPRLCGRA